MREYTRKLILLFLFATTATDVAGEPTMREPITIDAHHGTHNAFVASLCGVLQSWGHEVDYAYVSGLSGVAFSPVYDEGEDCRAWWMEGGDDIRLDFLGQALGFTAETVQTPEGVDNWEPYSNIDDMPAPRADYLRHLKTAVDRGDAVIVRTWPSWSVLTGWSNDLAEIPFVTVPGFQKLVHDVFGPHRTGLAYILSPADVSLTREEAIQRALTFGLSVADGTFENERFHYGGALYTAAAERLDHETFCEPCGDQSWSCAIRTLNRIAGAAESAADFLEQIGRSRASGSYRAIQTAASEYTGRQLEEGWNDPAFRNRLTRAFSQLHQTHLKATSALAAAQQP